LSIPFWMTVPWWLDPRASTPMILLSFLAIATTLVAVGPVNNLFLFFSSFRAGVGVGLLKKGVLKTREDINIHNLISPVSLRTVSVRTTVGQQRRLGAWLLPIQ
jgi:hypothetical protein